MSGEKRRKAIILQMKHKIMAQHNSGKKVTAITHDLGLLQLMILTITKDKKQYIYCISSEIITTGYIYHHNKPQSWANWGCGKFTTDMDEPPDREVLSFCPTNDPDRGRKAFQYAITAVTLSRHSEITLTLCVIIFKSIIRREILMTLLLYHPYNTSINFISVYKLIYLPIFIGSLLTLAAAATTFLRLHN